jgi:hypothetical protein|tara:strand:+ start:581 stop:775 length:195 start_codon:yes stop_codon:yes gene_type:complete
MITDTLSIKTIAGNVNTKEHLADITIEVHLKAEYSDIEEFLRQELWGRKAKISHLNKLIKKRIK